MTISTGDRLPPVRITLSGDEPVDITTANSTRILGRRNRELIIDSAPDDVVVEGDTSVIRYDWEVGKTDEVGAIDFEVEVTWSPGIVQTFRCDPDDHVDVVLDFDQWTA